MQKHGGGKLILESDEEIFLPKKDEKYVLENNGEEYDGRPCQRSMKATFTIPFKSRLFFDYEFTVLLQFVGNTHVYVFFERADLYRVFKWLSSTFRTQFRLKEIHFFKYDLLKMWDRWPWNMDFLLAQFKYDPTETLSFVKAHLPELITVMSLRKIPRLFNEPFKFVVFEPSSALLE